jgi:hypothetical protein
MSALGQTETRERRLQWFASPRPERFAEIPAMTRIAAKHDRDFSSY